MTPGCEVQTDSTPSSGVPAPARGRVSPPVAVPRHPHFSIVVASSPEELLTHVDAWEELAETTIEPNPFFEHWMLLPAMRLLGAARDLRVVLVYAQNPVRPAGPKLLCGVFPLERTKRYRGLPVSSLSLWRHKYCFLSVPLIRTGCAEACLRAFFDWLATTDHGAALMEFQRITGEGPISEALVSLLYERHSLAFISDAYVRAFLKPAADADSYLRAAMSREHRKDIRRRSRRLAERGHVEYSELLPGCDVDEWIGGYLDLEFQGWKGRDGGAFSCHEGDREFFISIVKEAFRRQRLMMLSLSLNGKPISYKCNFLSGEGSFAFKIAYDEEYSHFSPGLMLEMENIKKVHSRKELAWMDSCASPEHPMIDRLWLDRRVIESVVVPTGRGSGGFWVSVLPLVRWANRIVRRRRPLRPTNTHAEVTR